MKTYRHSRHWLPVLLAAAFPVVAIAAPEAPPASPEVAAAMQPYLDSHKLAGVIGIVANRGGPVVSKNLLGYADVEAGKPMREDNAPAAINGKRATAS